MTERENNMPVWPGWETVRLIGRGSFGAVYEIRRDVFGDTEHCAMKHISIPQSENEILEMRSEGQNEESISRTFAEQAKYILTEYKLMTRLNSCPNVVVCHDVNYVEKNGGLGWDIDIRMELLTSLMQRLSEQADWPESETLCLGKDMARALCACRELAILHRDVKPQNIFVAKDGRYKLGDFGIARTAEKSDSATMRTGTFAYMAPEVYHGRHYGPAADQYSLGMVLYWLLNERRGPFVNVNTPREKEAALYRRMGGEEIPAPAHGSEELKRIVLKCCAYDPEERFQSPEELLKALENAEFGVRNPEFRDNREARGPIETKGTAQGVRKPVRPVEPKTEGKTGNGDLGSAASGKIKKKKWLPILIGVAAAVAALAVLLPKGGQKPAPTAAPVAIEEPMAKASPEPTPEPTAAPTAAPTASPTPAPTPEPLPHVEGDWSWNLEGGVLIIRGSGNMPNFDYDEEPPWEAQKEEITRVVIEDGITGIGNWAFCDCDNMSTVEIPQSVTYIGESAFEYCDYLSTVEIPQSVTSIGMLAFGCCYNLVAIEVDSGNPNYKSVDGVMFSKDGTTLIYCPAGNERTEYTIPDSVTTIGNLSFLSCERLKSVEIPPSVQTIESQAFYHCGIETIRIPANVREMTRVPFEDCESLRYIEVDSGNPNYKSVDGVLYTRDGASLICYPAKSDRTAYTIPEGVTTICELAFNSCKSLRSIEIPESVQCIDWEAFWGCENLRSIKIPESVTTIYQYAFWGCESLRSIEIPESVQSIGWLAFNYCNSLTDLYYSGTKTQWEELVGDKDLGLPESVKIHFES